MKLSVQYLQKAWEENSPQIDLIISRISKTLIEQIDTLSVIAGEFSNFAQMPKTEKQIVNLGEVINNTLTLYGGMNGILLSVEVETDKATFVLADKNQLLRVFNNLIKNAIQSIPEGRQGIIKIRLQIRNENYFISITDNGVGIPAEKIPFIFSPNFTTKTAGMGLGLAMVKSIIEGSEGKIWFETSPDKGTSFFVSLPIQNPKNI